MTKAKLKALFPIGCKVEATREHCEVVYQESQGLTVNFGSQLLTDLTGVVVGYSRDCKCIRVIKFGSSQATRYHRSFYKKTADHVDVPISAWIKGRFVNA